MIYYVISRPRLETSRATPPALLPRPPTSPDLISRIPLHPPPSSFPSTRRYTWQSGFQLKISLLKKNLSTETYYYSTYRYTANYTTLRLESNFWIYLTRSRSRLSRKVKFGKWFFEAFELSSEEGESLTRNEARSKERRNQQIRRGKHLIRVCEPLPPPPGSRAKENEEHFPIFVCGYDVGLNPPPPQNLECPIRDGIIDLVREESRVHTRNDNIFKGEEGSIPQLPSSFFVSKTWVTCFLQLSLSLPSSPSSGQFEKIVRQCNFVTSILPRNVSRCWNRSDLTRGTNRGRRASINDVSSLFFSHVVEYRIFAKYHHVRI